MDYLKKLSVDLVGKIKQQNHSNANIGVSNRKLIIKDYRQFHVEIDEYINLYSLSLKLNSKIAFSVNKHDIVFGFYEPNRLIGLSNIIYTRNREEVFLHDKSFQKFRNLLSVLLKNLVLTDRECIFFYSNQVIFAIESKRDIVVVLDKIIDLLKENNTIFKKEARSRIDPKNIPDNLKVLLPFLKKYSIPDDTERDQLVEEMTDKEKTRLKDIVNPLMTEIENYLDSFNNKPLTNEGSLIGNLAELVSELNL